MSQEIIARPRSPSNPPLLPAYQHLLLFTFPLLSPVSLNNRAMSSSSVQAQQESHQRVGYDTSARKWAGQGIATISDRSGQVLFSIPIEFLGRGLVNNFAYVLQSIRMSYDVRDGQICNEEGVKCNPLDAVTPGRFVYWSAGMHRSHRAYLTTSGSQCASTADKPHYFSALPRQKLSAADHALVPASSSCQDLLTPAMIWQAQ